MLIWLTLACGSEKEENITTEPEQEEQQEQEEEEEEQEEEEEEEEVLDEVYEFQNADGDSSVSYTGQICRQVLIHDIKGYISNLDDEVLVDVIVPGSVVTDLNFYFETASDIGGDVPHQFSADMPLEQLTYGDISSGKNLVGKLAGNDSATDHKDWGTEFIGWDDGSGTVFSPQSLVEHWFAQLDDQASGWGTASNDVLGNPLESVYVTPEGQDLKQLIEKFLRSGISFSQAADDYMDDDVAGKGLLASHVPVDGKS